jgi:hypothetical protein
MLVSGCIARGSGQVDDNLASRQGIAIRNWFEQVAADHFATLRRTVFQRSGSIERDDARARPCERLQKALSDESSSTSDEN